LAYVWTGAKATLNGRQHMEIEVDGKPWFDGAASCVLFGNCGTVTGGIHAFEHAEPDDGWLDVGVVTAKGMFGWGRVLVRMATGHGDRSSLTKVTRARKVNVKLQHKTLYELDGGERPATRQLKVRVRPGAITLAAPWGSEDLP